MNRKGKVTIWGATNSRGRLVKETIGPSPVQAKTWAKILNGQRVKVEVRVVRG